MPDSWGLAAIAAKLLLSFGVLTAAGTVFAMIVFSVTGVRGFARLSAVIGLIGAAIGFALGGASLTGDLAGMYDPEMLGLLWSTQAGTALALQLGGLALLIVGLAFGRAGLWLAGCGGLLALGSFASVGHIPGRETPVLQAALLVHLIAAALWLGILTPLRRLSLRGPMDQAGDLAERFGRLAMIFVPLLVLAGVVMSVALVGSVSALLGTGYGQALILKVLLVAALLGLAALNKLRFVPRMIAGETGAARHLGRAITLEWLVVLAILLTTAVLTSTLTLPA